MSDDIGKAEQAAMRTVAGYLATEQRFAQWAWDEPEPPDIDEDYMRSICPSARMDRRTAGP